MREFNIHEARMNQIIRESSLFEDISQLLANSSEGHRIYVTCLLGVTISIALVDNKIFQSEIDEIIKALPKGLNLSENLKKTLVELSMSKSLLVEGFSSELPHFMNYLNHIMKEQDKRIMVELLFKIAWSDKHLSTEENKLIVSLSKRLGFSDQETLKIRNHVQSTYKPGNNIELVEFKFDAKKSKKEISRKKFLQNLTGEQSLEAHKILSENTLFYFLNKKYQKISDTDLFFLTSYLGLSFSFIISDDVIYEKEIFYVKNQIANWFDLGDIHDEIIDICSYFATNRNECFSDKNNLEYAKVLSYFLDSKECKELIRTLFNLSYSVDEDVHSNELKIIYEVAKILKLDGDMVANLKSESLGIEGSFRVVTPTKIDI